jgi:hypothetical protein
MNRVRKFAARAALFALASAAGAALPGCYYSSMPANSAAGANCQKTTYGVAMLTSSSSTACDENAPPPSRDEPAKSVQQ